MAKDFSNTDGTWLALGVTGLIAAAVTARGSRNDGDDDTQLPEIWEQPRRREHGNLPERRRRAELAMPDQDLARRIMYGGNILGDLTLQEAALYDPRRIDALISQRMGQAFTEVMGMGPGPQAEQMYLASVDFARKNYGGDLPARAVVSLIEENLDRALFSTWPLMPGHMKAHLRDNLPVFFAALDDSIGIANEAARATRGHEDNAEWLRLAEYLEGHKPMMRRALTEGLPGPARRGALPGRLRELPGPGPRRGGRNCGCGGGQGSRCACTQH